MAHIAYIACVLVVSAIIGSCSAGECVPAKCLENGKSGCVTCTGPGKYEFTSTDGSCNTKCSGTTTQEGLINASLLGCVPVDVASCSTIAKTVTIIVDLLSFKKITELCSN